jgi:hypothetical protein
MVVQLGFEPKTPPALVVKSRVPEEYGPSTFGSAYISPCCYFLFLFVGRAREP